MNLAYDPNSELSYGFWECPICKNRFYGGGSVIHRDGCPFEGYNNCVYYFTKKEVESAKREAEVYENEHITIPLGHISVAILKKHGFGRLL